MVFLGRLSGVQGDLREPSRWCTARANADACRRRAPKSARKRIDLHIFTNSLVTIVSEDFDVLL